MPAVPVEVPELGVEYLGLPLLCVHATKNSVPVELLPNLILGEIIMVINEDFPSIKRKNIIVFIRVKASRHLPAGTSVIGVCMASLSDGEQPSQFSVTGFSFHAVNGYGEVHGQHVTGCAVCGSLTRVNLIHSVGDE